MAEQGACKFHVQFSRSALTSVDRLHRSSRAGSARATSDMCLPKYKMKFSSLPPQSSLMQTEKIGSVENVPSRGQMTSAVKETQIFLRA
ncbi:hypothetical protein M514_00018 [Trichuris suis]|uniref:Uncharacterized protein n=1 Tax=Trichuris suis TaxID=68888 RepID=A0A085MNQ9_9BILA|nr:hypothetical protein M513_00018 [Trichuris suis]KFD72864.1 hypothetical protein M514_00018 [Trichuris suis]